MSSELEISKSLHPLERKILPFLEKFNDLNSLQEASKLKEVEAMRALQWLENKNVLKLKTQTKAIISLDKNGIKYKENGLPEINFLKSISQPLTLGEIQKKANLDQDELQISIGILKKKSLIELKKEITLTEQGKRFLQKQSLEEKFIQSLPKSTSDLTDEERFAYQELSKRKEIIRTDLKKIRTFELTDLGRKLSKLNLTDTYLESLTPELIKSQSWKNTKFRHYDINSIVPRLKLGKKHPLSQALEYIRKIWLEMGFEEMQGPLIDSSFWIFDALFTPQDHPAREMQDTLFISKKFDLPDKSIVENVKKAHEKGVLSSKGWQYKWNPEEAKRAALRPHTTSLSVRALSQLKKENLPKKYFSIGKVFRNETLDWSHLFEFHQTEGIVVDENLTLRNLLGYLKEFFNKMGFEKARFRPGYFAYVEPGVEIDVFHPIHKKWIELGGAGILRPEVVYPLMGKDYPVLAWGLGIERIISDYYQLSDIRNLYNNDIKQLREFKIFLR